MKVRMLETYQGVGQTATLLHEDIRVSVLEQGESYDVDPTLGAWLVDNRKAEEIAEAKPVHYGAQAEPELRHDDELYAEQTAEPEAQAKPEPDPIMTSDKAPKRTSNAKKK